MTAKRRRKSLPRKGLGRRGRAASVVTPLIPTTYDDSGMSCPIFTDCRRNTLENFEK